ncbi:acyltransferase [Halobacillus sp. GSS1]|uniref:acyltransferase family protein n=1 Tax=Halobacillus sp. GSS1 TaxID=2815919 RepID=UPI001A8E7BF6|nr:acyltransferase family protein [Halobacillus sp. GSS1]MBN9655082.1 acyltransferase [Halobacillus sp. GSS1]
MHQLNNPRRIRFELEGLRAVAAILVAIYHIWFNRVSGGVDVFFVVSGFLITTSLLSMYRKNGRIFYFSYIIKLLKRLLPTAWLIGIATFAFSFLVLPVFTRYQVLSEFIASSFYFQNWRLATDAVDYLAQNNGASPFQHFWALSIQFQFYIIWLVLFFITLTFYRLFRKAEFNHILLLTIGVIIVASFSYSVYLTNVNQPVAYYHTFTRVWEFGIGGILALTIHKITVSKPLAWVFGWSGLFGLLSGGIIFQVSSIFPGYAALWPVFSAVLIIVAGNQVERLSAYRVLSWKPLVKFGGISYAFYLWHWPLLIFYYAYFDLESVSFFDGLGIIGLASIFAYLTIHFVEKPIRSMQVSVRKTASVITVVAAIIIIPTVYYGQTSFSKEGPEVNIGTEMEEHPGAKVMAMDGLSPKDLDFDEPFKPGLDVAYQDRADIYPDGCLVSEGDTEVKVCEYGSMENFTHTIALVGGSHSAHWLPMLQEIAEDYPIKITTYLKGNCRFTTESRDGFSECDDWFESVMDELSTSDPDLIFSVGDVGSPKEDFDLVSEGFVEAWEYFNEENIPLLLVRDTPWYKESTLDCINENTENPGECKVARDEVIRDPSPLSMENPPPNVTTVDVTDSFCDDDYCYYIVGNVVTHFDSNHMTATFSRTLAPIMEEEILEPLNITDKY